MNAKNETITATSKNRIIQSSEAHYLLLPETASPKPIRELVKDYFNNQLWIEDSLRKSILHAIDEHGAKFSSAKSKQLQSRLVICSPAPKNYRKHNNREGNNLLEQLSAVTTDTSPDMENWKKQTMDEAWYK